MSDEEGRKVIQVSEGEDWSKFEIELNGMVYRRIPGLAYGTNITSTFIKHRNAGVPDMEIVRALCLESLFFIVYFVLKVPIANCEWWVNACREVETGPRTDTLDLWARFHGKSTIITVAETVQRILRNPEERICIFSWKVSVAMSFFRQIKYLFETSDLLKDAFPDVFYRDPAREAPKWSETEGIWCKRVGTYKEPTLMSAGLIEGAPTGFHFTGRLYDDVMTADLTRTPEMMEQVKQAFDMSQNLKTGTAEDWQRVIGTPYHHTDVLMYIQEMKDDNGQPIYHVRKKPATKDGSANGASAYLAEEELTKLRANRRIFNSQQLLNPTPDGDVRLEAEKLIEVEPRLIPPQLFKFMAVDPAGMRLSDSRTGDSWALVVVGVEPFRDDAGASNVFILDLVIEPMTEAQAMQSVVDMFCRNGQVRQIGVEKAGISTAEIHISKALHARGRAVTVENGGLVVLRPGGRSKESRIEAALSWPLINSKLHISTAIPIAHRQRLKTEMQKFPFWKDDGIDAVSYAYDMIKSYRFGKVEPQKKDLPWWERKGREVVPKNRWLYV